MTTNQDRVDRADALMMTHQIDDCMGNAEMAREEIERAPQSVVSYVLADLMHYCKAKGLSFQEALTMAEIHHQDEVDEESEDEGPVTDDERSYGPHHKTRKGGDR